MLNENFFEEVQKFQPKLEEVNINKDSPLSVKDVLSDTTLESPSLKLPTYDKNVDYHSEFYNIFCKNQSLMQQLEQEASDRNHLLIQIMKINEFYDQNIEKLKAERY